MSQSSVSTERVPTVQDAVAAPPSTSVSIWIPGCHLTVRPGFGNDQVEVEATVPNADPTTAQHVLDALALSLDRDGDEITLGTPPPGPRDRVGWRHLRAYSGTVQVEVHVPNDIDLTVRASGGRVDLRELGGSTRLFLSGAPLNAERLRGHFDVRAYGGSVCVREFSGRTLSVQTAAGAVTLQSIDARSIRVRAAAAPVTLSDLHGDLTLGLHGSLTTVATVDAALAASVHGGSFTLRESPDARHHVVRVGTSRSEEDGSD